MESALARLRDSAYGPPGVAILLVMFKALTKPALAYIANKSTYVRVDLGPVRVHTDKLQCP